MAEIKYKLFNEKYVYIMWDSVLKGCKCFCSDKISDLIRQVENNSTEELCTIVGFNEEGFDCYDYKNYSYNKNFVYFDPLYDIKIGILDKKQIQVRYKDNNYWVDVDAPERYFYDDDFELRVKP